MFLLVLFLGAVSWSYRLVLAPTHSFWEELGNWRFRADLYLLKTICKQHHTRLTSSIIFIF